jgi:hypothetical protein
MLIPHLPAASSKPQGVSMDQLHVFVSVGGTASAAQEAFISAVEDRLKSEGMIPHTIGRNTFSTDAPLKAVPT